MRHPLILAAVAIIIGAPALGRERDPHTPMNCPSMTRESRMQSLESKIESLRTRLDSLDTRLQSFEVDRRQTLDEAKASIEAAVRNGALSQAEIDKAVTSALARADVKAKSAAASAATAHAQMKATRVQLESLVQQLHTLAHGSSSSVHG